MVVVVDCSADISTIIIHDICQCRMQTSRSAVKSHDLILIVSGEHPRSLVSFRLCLVDYWAHFFAQSAINAFRLVNDGIPKTFPVRLKGYGGVSTYISTSVASATLGFINDLYHIKYNINLCRQSTDLRNAAQ